MGTLSHRAGLADARNVRVVISCGNDDVKVGRGAMLVTLTGTACCSGHGDGLSRQQRACAARIDLRVGGGGDLRAGDAPMSEVALNCSWKLVVGGATTLSESNVATLWFASTVRPAASAENGHAVTAIIEQTQAQIG